jgi:hypothetical protein|tara:strand:+ start:276 stop:461 length:186 start_codon:yes stop_codon:yes gene_type:complete
MSVKPGTTSKKTISAANGLGSLDAPSSKTGVGSETMNPPSPVEYGRAILNYSTDFADASSL